MISDSLFEQQLRDLKVEAYEAVPYSWPLRIFTEFWESVTEMIERGRKNGSDVGLDMFKSLSEQEWREAMLRMYDEEGNKIGGEVQVEGMPDETKEQPQWLDMFTKYAMKDSGNRVQMLMNQIEINMDAPIREYFKEQFGEEAGILLTEIMEGLNEQEQERLATGPKRKVKKPEMSVETIEIEEPSLPEAENEDELLASLDFLDADIDEMLSLEELEDELNLDDLNLD